MKRLIITLLTVFAVFSIGTFLFMNTISALLQSEEITSELLPSFIESMMPKVILSIVIIIIFVVLIILSLTKKKYKINLKEQTPSEKFDIIYDSVYQNYISELEKQRKKVRLRTIIANILLIIVLIGHLMGRTGNLFISSELNFIIVIASIIAFLLYIVVLLKNYTYKKEYEKAYKNNVLEEFIRLLNDKLIYKPDDIENANNSRIAYQEAQFDDKVFNRYFADDYMEGYLDEETFVKMVDIDVKKVTGSGKNRHVEQIFDGLFAITTCNKDIETYIKITKDKRDFFGGKDRTNMDSEEFEKLFNVYSEDRILAVRLLTSDIMNMLIDFYNKYKLTFEIVIRNNNIYLRFRTGAMFEPKIFGNSMDKELLYIYYCILEFVLQLTRQINKTIRELDI